MANNNIKSVNFLPEYLRTEKNNKFLSATIDQWIQSPQLERINGYIGSKITPTYNSTSDVYISETSTLRSNYQLTPALIVNDALFNVQDVIGIDDLVNEISLQGGNVSNFDRLFRSDFYSYNPFVDWDKLVNYQNYYWLVMGPDTIEVLETRDQIINEIINQKSYTNSTTGLTLTNGLKLRFINPLASEYYENDYFVEGVGSDLGIRLVNFQDLITPEPIAGRYDENFDIALFDLYQFDNVKTLPLTPEYTTINRASQDINSWSRYNRWVHAEVIRVTAEYKNQIPVYPSEFRAQRPIIEFAPDLKLYNYGTVGIPNVDFLDTITADPTKINGNLGYYIDQVLIEQGNRIIFNSSADASIIYRVTFDQNRTIQLIEDATVTTGAAVSIDLGVNNHGTDWHFDGSTWQKSQQHTIINQAPLFDLFNNDGISYSDPINLPSDFTGSQIFGYTIGTGTNDPYLGFPLKYRNNVEQGDYLFTNYFMTDVISITAGTQFVIDISSSITYVKFSNLTYGEKYNNVWTNSTGYQIPIIQLQTTTESTSSIAITAIDSPTNQQITLEVYVNNQKINSVTTSTVGQQYLVNFDNALPIDSDVLFKIYTDATANANGYYETPLGLTNNPLNGLISYFTLSDLNDHVKSMTLRSPDFVGVFPGVGNLRDLPNISQYGTRLISNANPIAFANMFVGKKEHSVINAISKVSDHYTQFKNQIISQLNRLVDQQDPVSALDLVLTTINQDKTSLSPYNLSDMIGYGTDKKVTTYNITDNTITSYAIDKEFDISVLGIRSVLVYVNGVQLILNLNYVFELNDNYVTISSIFEDGEIRLGLRVGDIITIVDYSDTSGSYVPPTPSKLGLYPAYQPKKYLDDTYSIPQMAIQGHDGSITIAYNDFRDDVLLEFEKRVYNNIKSIYRPELFDVNSVFPGAFRKTQYSVSEINEILESSFVKWSGFNGIDYINNTTFNSNNSKTWNYTGSYVPQIDTQVSGYWRSVFKYLYDTDRPHTNPWEMLGFNEKPYWWDDEYGGAPYTSANTHLWQDLEEGRIRSGTRVGVDTFYSRPGLFSDDLLPVDISGNLVDLSESIVTNITLSNRRQNWKFGDQSPAETAWRRSSQWPFAIQRLLALTTPASYASLMYDVSRVELNNSNQWIYKTDNRFFNLNNVAIHGENNILTSGYSVLISEVGQQRSQNYITTLRSNLSYVNFNLFYKVGGFVSKNTLQIIIDAYEPNSNSPGALLPQEDVTLILNVSNPVKSIGISGIVVQKSDNGTFIIKGYDTQNPYFTVYTPIRSNNTPSITIGGISEPYVTWTSDSGIGNTGLSAVDTTTAASATGIFYQAGQIVANNGQYYRVTVSHRGESTFNHDFYQLLPSLPTSGGASALTANKFDNIPTKVLYGTEFRTIQQVYDVIVGYGAWLTDQGFIFDEYNSDVNDVINWQFTGKEFLYWTTQNWSTNNVITLSPFADQIKYSNNQSVVENIFDNYYEYSLLSANGLAFPKNNLSINRSNGVCTIVATTSTDGIYYAKLNSIQKEHAMVFSNTTIFNDVVYDIETGYQQQRMKISGFRTSNWTGDISSPGFIYDNVSISNWKENTYYQSASVVRYNGLYYSALGNIEPTSIFDFLKWEVLLEKPTSDLLPNFDYKINQFQDFYSLDIDNFDTSQEKMAQHLTGYTPRNYLNNIFTDPIAQYKFYQGFIREKGTRNAVQKLSKATIQNFQGNVDFTEEWAFRIGAYGSYTSYKELENILVEGTFLENPQIIQYIDVAPAVNNLIFYSTSSNITIKPDNYDPSKTFYITSGTYKENNYILPTAGFVRADDVTFTAYSENSLLDILNNQVLNLGDTAWLGFKQNSEWDVLRYTLVSSSVIEATVTIPGVEIQFTTNGPHRLSAGEIISLTQFTDQLNGIYFVASINSPDQFSIKSNEIYIDQTATPGSGQLFKFVTARASNFDSFPLDNELLELPENSLVWTDSDTVDGNGKWAVYSKTKNYYPTTVSSGIDFIDEHLGYSISRLGIDNIFVVGSPGQKLDYGSVTAHVKVDDISPPRFKFFLNQDTFRPYYDSQKSNVTGFGHDVVYDDYVFPGTNNGLIFVGAPKTSYVKTVYNTTTNINIALTTATASTYVEQGLVTISSIDPVSNEETRLLTLVSPSPAKNEYFGSSLYVQLNTSSKLLLVGAPGKPNSVGSVYAFQVGSYTTGTTSTLTISVAPKLLPSESTKGMQWGHSISGSDDGSVIAIGAPGYNDKTGLVNIFRNTGTYLQQVITPPADFDIGSGFGEKVEVSPDGSYLFVSAPNVYSYTDNNKSYGKVLIYKNVNGEFSTSTVQILDNPLISSGLKFGHDISINPDNDILVVSALGVALVPTAFDEYQTRNIGGKSIVSVIETANDFGSTEYYSEVERTGSIYVYNRQHDRFVFAEELPPISPLEGTDYGYSLIIDRDNSIYVGAPAFNNQKESAFYQYNSTATSAFSWQTLRSQEDMVNIDTIRRIVLIDTFNEKILNYLETIDPAKGKISGLADQEIKYKSMFDPAIYTIGSTGTVVNPLTTWTDDHVGELWWDLSSVKYQWYEQGDLEYRKNNWGKFFPGSTIDVYEWVGSYLLPSQWNTQADTTVGLTQGISGQPKFIDDSTVSAKQIYNSISDSFTNYYFYWVKNKVIVPNTIGRNISAYQVATIIADPIAHGIQFASALSADAIALANIPPAPIGSNVSINIAMDLNPTNIPKHTEWLLLQENNINSMPDTLLEKKLLDSLIGHDSLGNLVPDPNLSQRQAYGIEIRPRQSMFVNRFQALRNLIDFTNRILINNPITGNYSFKNLTTQEEQPDQYSHEYDQILDIQSEEDLYNLIDTRQLTADTAAVLTATIYNGQVISVDIVNPGFGYLISPNITVTGNNNDPAVITTEINSNGQIVLCTIENAGSGYVQTPELTARPYTVIINNDPTSNNKWSKYVWDAFNKRWTKTHTQQYNTALYWNYIDYSSPTYNRFRLFDYTIDSTYELETLTEVKYGQYIKIKNIGDGRSVVITPAVQGTYGTFSNEYDLLWSQNGTIQLSNNLWDVPSSQLGFDQYNNYDETLYNQAPDLELQYILTALKNDIFINELKINWNLFFFTAVKYCLYEQKLLDWAFKTTFINVTNYAGELDQRSVYKISTSEYFEDYINEVKPYHTQIRSFTTNQTVLDPVASYNTDFDLPSHYDPIDDQFEIVEVGNTLTNVYPWKSWSDNYSYSVGEITVNQQGEGYTEAPNLIISPPDLPNGTTATAEAYIGLRHISFVRVINSGTGYIKNPTVSITGGGSVTTTATFYAKLVNNTVRKNIIDVKFDRISLGDEIGNLQVTDKFVCDGSRNEFVLNWLAQPDKQKINVTLDGDVVLIADYTIKYYKEFFNGYDKKYSKIAFLNYIPKYNQILKVEYEKNISLMTAIERLGYFTDIVDFSTVTSGLVYPQTRLEGPAFGHSSAWTEAYPNYDTFAWADEVANYTSKEVISSSDNLEHPNWTSVTVSSTADIRLYQYANVPSIPTNIFVIYTGTIYNSTFSANQYVTTTGDLQVMEIGQGFVIINGKVDFTLPNARDLQPGDVIEFWDNDSNFSVLDSIIQGGAWSTSTNSGFMNILGIDPEDVEVDTTTGLYYLGGNNTIVDGDGYYTNNTGYTPEELISGQASDSLGINVYTKELVGAPTIYSSSAPVLPGVRTFVPMKLLPPSKDSITVNFNNQLFRYNATTSTTDAESFSIDWGSSTLILPPQNIGGLVGYTIITSGGEGYIDTDYLTFANRSSAQLSSLAGESTVKSVYVTLDGIALSTTTSTSNPYYEFGNVSSNNYRAAVNIYNASTTTSHLAQAWFFVSKYKHFNEVKEEGFVFSIATTSTYELSQPPGIIGPPEANIIVEVTDSSGTRILQPPDIKYYEILDPTATYPLITNTIKVYRNGLELEFGFDYSITIDNSLKIVNGVSFVGDVIAVVSFTGGPLYDYYIDGNLLVVDPQGQFTNSIPNYSTGGTAVIKAITYTNHDSMLMRKETFDGNTSGRYKISRPVLNNNYIWVSVNGIALINKVDYVILEDQVTVQLSDQFSNYSLVRVTITSLSSDPLATTVLGYRTFVDMFNNTQFKRLSAQNTTYLTQPLNFSDTEIHVADAGVLSQPLISKKIPGVVIIAGERIEFFRVSNNTLSQLRRSTLGTAPNFYNDIYTKVIDQGITQTIPYSERILKQTFISNAGFPINEPLTTNTYIISTTTNSVYYTKDTITLSNTSTAILQSNTYHNNLEYIQISINGQLVDDQVYTNLDLTTLAVVMSSDPPNFVSSTGTAVALVYGLSTSSSYVIEAWFIGKGATPANSDARRFTNNGITLQSAPVDSTKPIPVVDQVEVYYGGRLLRKTGMFHQDTTVSYDNPITFYTTATVATALDLPQKTKEIGIAYITTDTNRVWVYTGSKEFDAISGYVYRGLNYLPPEFSINTSTQELTLNIPEGLESQHPVRVDIVKREFNINTEWNDVDPENSGKTLSIMDSTSTQARFLQARPAELPDNYYYGGSQGLTDNSGFELTIGGEPLGGL
jgi:hypothetical protein